MNTYEINQTITIQNRTYKIISVTVNSPTERPNLYREGYWQNLFVTATQGKSKRVYSVVVLTDGRMTRPSAL